MSAVPASAGGTSSCFQACEPSCCGQPRAKVQPTQQMLPGRASKTNPAGIWQRGDGQDAGRDEARTEMPHSSLGTRACKLRWVCISQRPGILALGNAVLKQVGTGPSCAFFFMKKGLMWPSPRCHIAQAVLQRAKRCRQRCGWGGNSSKGVPAALAVLE